MKRSELPKSLSPEGANVLREKQALGYATLEEQAARKHNTPTPYFLLDDSLCKQFLRRATTPFLFEGLKRLFPFVREGSVLQVPRTRERFSLWVESAFYAGHDLGRAEPELLSDVLPGAELMAAEGGVGIIQTLCGGPELSFDSLRGTCQSIAEGKLADLPDERVEPVLLETVVKSLRAGFAAATITQYDPTRCEFFAAAPERISAHLSDILSRAWVGAPLSALGKSVVELLEHPLLRLARELYQGQPKECEAVLRFLRGRLRALDVKSENECPVSELDLADWVSEGLAYGRQLKAKHPEIVEAIFDEHRSCGLQRTFSLVRGVVAEAGETEPLRLVSCIKTWHQQRFGWAEVEFYGQGLARVANFSDFAIWIGWTGLR